MDRKEGRKVIATQSKHVQTAPLSLFPFFVPSFPLSLAHSSPSESDSLSLSLSLALSSAQLSQISVSVSWRFSLIIGAAAAAAAAAPHLLAERVFFVRRLAGRPTAELSELAKTLAPLASFLRSSSLRSSVRPSLAHHPSPFSNLCHLLAFGEANERTSERQR